MPVKFKNGNLTANTDTKPDTQPVSGVMVQPQATIIHQHTKDKGKTIISDDLTQEAVGDPVMVPEAHGKAGYSAGRVWSDGDFGSYRVGVSLDWPVADYKSIEEIYEFTRNWVNSKLVEELSKGNAK